jgi:hypothetical protein
MQVNAHGRSARDAGAIASPESPAMSYSPPLLVMCTLALTVVAVPVRAAEPAPALALEWDLRVRHEQVDDAVFGALGLAGTARLRVGLRFHPADAWTGLIEAEALAGSGHYNSGANGRVSFPQVLDPAGAELNQACLGWKRARGGAMLGRQRLLFDNQRWIGNVGWRQNEQTFDAFSIEASPRKGLTLRYAYLDRVHRVAGDDARDPLARERALSTHAFNAAWKHDTQQWVIYAYMHEDRDVAAASSATSGVRWTGSLPIGTSALGWTIEAARQHGHANNPLHFSHAYWLLEPAITLRGVTARAGIERLGGNGTHALQAPLATLHAFNGWADKFLMTPSNGLQDRYLALGGSFGRERDGARPTWQLALHDYRADRGGLRYGGEWDASLSVPLRKDVSALLKVANYRADTWARDTRKLWLQIEYKG